MTLFIIKRLLQAIPVGIGITLAAFLAFFLAPGDPVVMMLGERASPAVVEQMRHRLGLDQPAHVQYALFLQRLVTGDLGTSYVTRMPVTETVRPALQATIRLAALGMVFTILIGIPVGVLSATRRNTVFDYTAMSITTVGISAPIFWIGIILVYVFAYRLGWLPSGGSMGAAVILPALTLGLHYGAMLARMTRSCMLEVLDLDYVRTANAKGLSNVVVTYKHAFKNAALPIVTLMGLQLGNLLGGTVVTETVFAWPGLGRLLLRGIFERDAPTIQAAVLLVALLFTLINIIVDVAYIALNPAVRYA